jgi:hypothetical protein
MHVCSWKAGGVRNVFLYRIGKDYTTDKQSRGVLKTGRLAGIACRCEASNCTGEQRACRLIKDCHPYVCTLAHEYSPNVFVCAAHELVTRRVQAATSYHRTVQQCRNACTSLCLALYVQPCFVAPQPCVCPTNHNITIATYGSILLLIYAPMK